LAAPARKNGAMGWSQGAYRGSHDREAHGIAPVNPDPVAGAIRKRTYSVLPASKPFAKRRIARHVYPLTLEKRQLQWRRF